MIADMRAAHLGPRQIVSQDQDALQIPNDVYYHISMGSDIGHMPQNSLMTISGLGEAAAPAQKAFMSPGDFCIVAGKDRLPIVLGVLMSLLEVSGEENGVLLGSVTIHFECGCMCWFMIRAIGRLALQCCEVFLVLSFGVPGNELPSGKEKGGDRHLWALDPVQ